VPHPLNPTLETSIVALKKILVNCVLITSTALPYLDMLLSDLGLDRHRKRTAIAEVFSPYGPADYTGIVNEWLATKTGIIAEPGQHPADVAG